MTDLDTAPEAVEEDALHPGEARLLDGPNYLNGRAKLYGAALAFLWSSLVGLGGWAFGSRSAALELQRHAATNGHPVVLERVESLETRILDRLNVIDGRLGRIERSN